MQGERWRHAKFVAQRGVAARFGEDFHTVSARIECCGNGRRRQLAAGIEWKCETEAPETRQHDDIEIRRKVATQDLGERHAPRSGGASLPASVSATTAPTRSRDIPSSDTTAACATYGCCPRRDSSSGSDTRLPSSLITRSKTPLQTKAAIRIERDGVIGAMPVIVAQMR